MKQYDDRATTPLMYHKFRWYVSLPLAVLITLIQINNEKELLFSGNWAYGIDGGYLLIILVLNMICFVGYFQWRAYAWYSTLISMVVQSGYAFIGIIIYALYLPSQIATALGQFLGVTTVSILIGIYYIKRKPLFFTGAVPAAPPTAPEPWEAAKTEAEKIPAAAEPRRVIAFCYRCGNRLTPGSNFCSQCGTPIAKDTEDPTRC